MQNKKEFTTSQFVIICVAVILAVATVCVTIILVKYFDSPSFQAAQEDTKQKLEDISIQVDGLSFTLKEKFGDTVRQIAKQRQPYWFDTEEARDMVIVSDIEEFLKRKYNNTSTKIEFKNRSNTFYNVSVTSPNDGVKHDSNYTLADSYASLGFNVRDNEVAYIDDFKIQANKTSRSELKSFFNDIQIQENDDKYGFATHIAKYKGRRISFSYQNGIIIVSMTSL